ncbi:hypothetical protein BpHYR1_006449 [Brachionus plicatilis]|uniref:Uncharacterized protein n=1 Tax=Brachionus plicatilis TaxID=10195 RepID=A0A3M7Q0W4_BRAPC|nr:hypothetical protein BpHYR1_006449 [Brachionus plicatilis]
MCLKISIYNCNIYSKHRSNTTSLCNEYSYNLVKHKITFNIPQSTIENIKLEHEQKTNSLGLNSIMKQNI